MFCLPRRTVELSIRRRPGRYSLFRSPGASARPSQMRRLLFLSLVSALLVATVPVAAQAASEDQVVINALGGNAGDPGLRIHYANGQLQVFRNGVAQLYWGNTPSNPPVWSYSGIALNLEGLAFATPLPFNASAFPNSTQSGGSQSGSGTISGTLDTGIAGFILAVAIVYHHPDEFYTVTLSIDRGATTVPLKLYHIALATAYESPGFHLETPQTVGLGQNGAYEAFRHVGGPAWTGYFSANYETPWDWIENGIDFNNAILTDDYPKTFGIMWDLGTTAGTQTVSYQMIFSDVMPPPAPAQMLAPTAVAGNGSATVSIVPPVDNGFPIAGYTVTGDPGGATCSIVPPEASCVVSGLANGTSYSFTATASNTNGVSAASPPSNSVVPTAPAEDPDPTPPASNAFIDITNGEMATAASWLANQGIILGCAAGQSPRFCPNDLATRAEVATFMTRALSLPATTVNAFTDDSGHPFEDNINRAAAAGLFHGCFDGMFCPDESISRAELAAVLVRALDLLSTTQSPFADIEGHWAESFITTIGGLGITNGCTADGTMFCPDTFGTRGEIALLLYRALTLE